MRKTPWGPFWKFFPFLALVPICVLSVYAVWTVSRQMDDIRRSEAYAVDVAREAVTLGLEQVMTDIKVLASQNELTQWLETGDEAMLPAIAREYWALSAHARVYDQIRFLNETGMEVVRVNFNGGRPTVVATPDLQDKSGRYYFTDAMALDAGALYVSRLDLNIEHGEIEVPYKPMIRISTPVADQQGRKRGVLLLNYLAEDLLARVQNTDAVSVGDPMMVDQEGYWLVSPNPPPSWGFMFPEGGNDRMSIVYPEVWAAMQSEPAGVVRTANGLFTYKTCFPLRILAETSRQDLAGQALASTPSEGSEQGYRWTLASHVPDSVLDKLVKDAVLRSVAIGVPLLVLLAVGTRAVTAVAMERRRHQAHLESLARFDSLTCLANRATFEERMEQEIQRARRHDRRLALIYIDLDGFKAINDTLGHQAGDQVLVDVARVLEANCRAEDVPARFGGDEFVVMLSEVSGLEGAHGVADKMLASIGALDWDGHRVGASMGVALWPTHGQETAQVMRQADEAMYAAKTAGKNRIVLAQAPEAQAEEPGPGGDHTPARGVAPAEAVSILGATGGNG